MERDLKGVKLGRSKCSSVRAGWSAGPGAVAVRGKELGRPGAASVSAAGVASTQAAAQGLPACGTRRRGRPQDRCRAAVGAGAPGGADL